VRALAAGEDPHRPGPAVQLVPARTLPQQPGQLGDVRFLDPAGPVPASGVAAGIIGAALADLAAMIDGDLPRVAAWTAPSTWRTPSARSTGKKASHEHHPLGRV